MKITELGTFLQSFLKVQGLEDCSISFIPSSKRGRRRAKRSTAKITLERPVKDLPRVQDGRTVAALTERLISLSKEIQQWTDADKGTYKPEVRDAAGERVKDDTLLKELRGRAAAKQAQATERARRILEQAARDCDRLLDADDVNRLLRSLAEERK